MSGPNPLVGLIGNYDSGSESESEPDGSAPQPVVVGVRADPPIAQSSSVTHPAPIPHCQWSACYDEGTGYTYYWHQITNEVTWEAPPEYLLALKVAAKLSASAQSEVTAEEWQLYQQALADKQKTPKPTPTGTTNQKIAANKKAANNHKGKVEEKKNAHGKKRRNSDSEDEKIEPITCFYRSDSDSESESPVKQPPKPAPAPVPPAPVVAVPPPKKLQKKQKTKPVVEFGPSLPPDQDYTVPIGPELPPNVAETEEKIPSEDVVMENENKLVVSEDKSNGVGPSISENQEDEEKLMEELMNKAKLLQKLGGELPTDLKNLIKPITSGEATPPIEDASRETTMDTNIDDLLEEIEKKEMPKLKPKKTVEKIDMFSDDANFPSILSEDLKTQDVSVETKTEVKSLFPSAKEILNDSDNNVSPAEVTPSLFPSASSIQTVPSSQAPAISESAISEISKIALEKKGANIYIMPSSEELEQVPKKKMRISSTVLPVKKSEVPSYTTKYSQYIDGFSTERTGLGFSKPEFETEDAPKKPVTYGNFMKFTKGETLNEDKEQDVIADETIDSMSELLEAKLKFLNQQALAISPVQEMTIQMQTLNAAYSVGALTRAYWRGWLTAAADSLERLETTVSPPGWTCRFHRAAGRYEYRRESDGHTQLEYPAGGDDMDICTTPPPPPSETETTVDHQPPPPPPVIPPPPPPSSPPPPPLPPLPQLPPPPPSWTPPLPPPPPSWMGDASSPPPPPPGCEEDVSGDNKQATARKESLGDELLSFYSDIAELEKVAIAAPTQPEVANTHTQPQVTHTQPQVTHTQAQAAPNVASVPSPTVQFEKKTVEENGAKKKKTKVKISAGMGMKQKTVSSLVAKWQQVQEQINSD